MNWGIIVILLTSAIFLGCSRNISIAEENLPPIVLSSFKDRYPLFKNAKWEIEKGEDRLIYEVDFTLDQKMMEAEFTKEGKFIEEYIFQTSTFKESYR
jgi:hypothetical protein